MLYLIYARIFLDDLCAFVQTWIMVVVVVVIVVLMVVALVLVVIAV